MEHGQEDCDVLDIFPGFEDDSELVETEPSKSGDGKKRSAIDALLVGAKRAAKLSRKVSTHDRAERAALMMGDDGKNFRKGVRSNNRPIIAGNMRKLRPKELALVRNILQDRNFKNLNLCLRCVDEWSPSKHVEEVKRRHCKPEHVDMIRNVSGLKESYQGAAAQSEEEILPVQVLVACSRFMAQQIEFTKHVQRRHPSVYLSLETLKRAHEKHVREAEEKEKKFLQVPAIPRPAKQEKEYLDAVLSMLVLNGKLPFNFWENDWACDFLNRLTNWASSRAIPSLEEEVPNTLKGCNSKNVIRHIDSISQMHQSRLADLIKEQEIYAEGWPEKSRGQLYSISLDGWESPSKHHFLAAYYNSISIRTGEFCSVLFCFEEVGDTSGRAMAAYIRDTLGKIETIAGYEKGKINFSWLVGDGASNNKTLCDHLGINRLKNRTHCFAHRLALVVKHTVSSRILAAKEGHESVLDYLLFQCMPIDFSNNSNVPINPSLEKSSNRPEDSTYPNEMDVENYGHLITSSDDFQDGNNISIPYPDGSTDHELYDLAIVSTVLDNKNCSLADILQWTSQQNQYFVRSGTSRTKLKKICEELGIKYSAPKMENATRWTGLCDRVSANYFLKPALRSFFVNASLSSFGNNTDYSKLSKFAKIESEYQGWSVHAQLVAVLRRLASFQLALQARGLTIGQAALMVIQLSAIIYAPYKVEVWDMSRVDQPILEEKELAFSKLDESIKWFIDEVSRQMKIYFNPKELRSCPFTLASIGVDPVCRSYLGLQKDCGEGSWSSSGLDSLLGDIFQESTDKEINGTEGYPPSPSAQEVVENPVSDFFFGLRDDIHDAVLQLAHEFSSPSVQVNEVPTTEKPKVKRSAFDHRKRKTENAFKPYSEISSELSAFWCTDTPVLPDETVLSKPLSFSEASWNFWKPMEVKDGSPCNAIRFPHIRRVQIIAMGRTATTAQVESLFSRAKLFQTDKRKGMMTTKTFSASVLSFEGGLFSTDLKPTPQRIALFRRKQIEELNRNKKK